MLSALRLLVLGAAGVASLAYLAFRHKPSPMIRRELHLASLEREVRNWLPKLPFTPFIRIEVPGAHGFLQVSGDNSIVDIAVPQATSHQRAVAHAFRQICSEMGFEARELAAGVGATFLTVRLPAAHQTVARFLETLLKDLYHLDAHSALVASVPSGAPVP